MSAAAGSTSSFASSLSGADQICRDLKDLPIPVFKDRYKRVNLNVLNSIGLTPLHVAVELKCLDKVNVLLELGARTDIYSREGLGKMPLHLAAILNQVAIATSLVKVGKANVCALTTHGFYTPLHLAAIEDFGEMIKKLIDLGAALEIKDKHGSTPLREACRWMKPEAITALLGCGAEFKSRDIHGRTFLGTIFAGLLTFSSYSDVLESVKALIRHGISIHNKTERTRNGILYSVLDKIQQEVMADDPPIAENLELMRALIEFEMSHMIVHESST